jgi:aryl-alcohol dehydrogenase-like predicted oxidoreductase
VQNQFSPAVRDAQPELRLCAELCLASELVLAPRVIPIPGASRPENILDSAGAVELELTDDEMARLSQP